MATAPLPRPNPVPAASASAPGLPPFPYADFLGRGLGYGVVGGACLGALFGTVIFPLIGTILGLVFGAIVGTFVGFCCGVALALLSSLCFFPLADWGRYRAAMTILAVGITLPTAQLGFLLLSPEVAINFGLFGVSFPAVIASGYAVWVTWRLSDWYAAVAPRAVAAQGAALYDPAFLRRLFDEMHSSYERVSHLASFGFGRRWRRLLVQLAPLQPGMQVIDLMSGSGELWEDLLPRIGPGGRITAVDFSPVASQHARSRRRMLGATNIAVLECDALNTSLPSGCADAVVCAYGLKTLSFADQERLAAELRRLLRPHGVFALLEIELPRSPLLRQPYAFYLCHVVPVIGRLLLGNPDNYRLLGRYLRQFAGAEQLAARIADRGFTVHSYPLFGGCAVALVGMRDGA